MKQAAPLRGAVPAMLTPDVRHRPGSGAPGRVPGCEMGQQWTMLKLFGAAVTTAEVLR